MYTNIPVKFQDSRSIRSGVVELTNTQTNIQKEIKKLNDPFLFWTNHMVEVNVCSGLIIRFK